MIAVSPASTKIFISGSANMKTSTEIAAPNPIVIRIALFSPERIRERSLAP